MITHYANTRGFADHGWLKSAHTFSFADYYNPERMHFGVLRVINDDVIAPGTGFGRHPHRDMEIITIPLEGSVIHEDSEGNKGVIKRGEIQVMSAGTGISHSEFSDEIEVTKLLQIWVFPKKLQVHPRYDQKKYSLAERKNKLQLIVSPDSRDQSLMINQDAFFSIGEFDDGRVFEYNSYKKNNGAYLFIISGSFEINGAIFNARDGIGMTQFDTLTLKSIGPSELLLMELPMVLSQS